ncbi:MAG: DUF4265 domain-containing protein [Pyrinomonadaceae bacterium]
MNRLEEKIVIHDFPAWREKANFIIGANLTSQGLSDLATSEQIWARQIKADVFEICCIPFFAYGFALGDWVITRDDGDDKYIINSVLERKGHTTYRLFLPSNEETNAIIDEIISLECLVEVRWRKSRLIAIDAPHQSAKHSLETFLLSVKQKTGAECEIAD